MPAEPQPILPAGIYIVSIDVNGNMMWLQAPAGIQAILTWDGTRFYWSDGSSQAQFNLGNLEINQGPYVSIATFAAGGRMLAGVTLGLTKYILTSQNGVVRWDELEVIGLPETGSGILIKLTGQDPSYFDATSSLMYFDENDEPFFLPFSAADNGKQLIIKDGIPQLLIPAGGTIVSGASSIGLDGVIANSIGVNQVNVQAPAFTMSDGATEETAIAINVTVDISNPAGPLGLDAGGEAINTWYYIYLLTDGVTVTAVISDDPATPDLTLSGGMTHWGLISMFRNDAAGNIVEYMQRGRHFYTVPVMWGDKISSGTALAAVVPSVALTTIIPPNVKKISGTIGGTATAPAATVARSMVIASTASGVAKQFVASRENASAMENFKYDAGSFYNLPIADPNAPQVFWRSNLNSANQRRIEIFHYEI